MAKLKLMSIACVLCLLFGVQAIAASADTPVDVYGSEANPTGDPLGGGEGYSRIVTAGDFSVSTKAELLSALTKAVAGQTIYVQPQAEIDLTGMINIAVPAGVTLAGNRGYQGSPGPLIYSNSLSTNPSLFLVLNDNVRFTGIRFRGPSGSTPNTVGLNFQADNIEVDNCEIYEWSNAGIHIKDAKNAYIHHNNIHHVQMQGLGYPICLNKATALIEANTFDYYRHAIAGAGFAGTGYEARYNWVGPHAISHAFDMHGGTDFCPNQKQACTAQDFMIAGDYVNIHHNTLEITNFSAIVLRGIPRQYVEVHHNIFAAAYPDAAFAFKNYTGGNSHVYQNLYGPKKALYSAHIQPSPFIYKTGVVAPYALADARLLKFGFTSPRSDMIATVKGNLNIELMPVEVTPYLGQPAELAPFKVTHVEIKLDSKTVIFSEDRMPNPGEVVYDTTQLTNGMHRFTMKISSNLSTTLDQSVTVRVSN